MTSQRAGLAGDTLHQATITKEAVCVVVDKVEAILVEDSGGVRLRDRQTNSVADTLAKGSGGDLNTRGVVRLGMAGSDAVNGLRREMVVSYDCWTSKGLW